MDDLTKKVQSILADEYGQEFDKGWFENGTLFKNIIKATEQALTITDVGKSFYCQNENDIVDKKRCKTQCYNCQNLNR